MLPLRLRRVAGHEGRVNDTLFQPAAERPPTSRPPHTLVYFGGDVQDYPEVMQAHRDNRNYLKWNLENTARMLSHNFPHKHILVVRPSRHEDRDNRNYLKWNLENTARMLSHNFPHKHILVVRPSRIEYKSFSCYDNFVPSNNAGVPDHTPTHSALHHLERLLQGVSSRLKAMPTSELLEAVTSVSLPEEIDIEDLHNASIHGVGPSKPNGSSNNDAAAAHSAPGSEPDTDPLWWRDKLALDESRLTLVGFSKGCVVLNQIIYEFHYTNTLTPGDAHTVRFMERIEEMCWLDGGHAGGKNTWITSRSLLETLTRLNLNLYVHVSPYQVRDEARPWIGREEKAFTSLLRKLGAKVHRYLHEQPGTPQSLQMHFEVLARFKRAQEHAPAPHDDDS